MNRMTLEDDFDNMTIPIETSINLYIDPPSSLPFPSTTTITIIKQHKSHRHHRTRGACTTRDYCIRPACLRIDMLSRPKIRRVKDQDKPILFLNRYSSIQDRYRSISGEDLKSYCHKSWNQDLKMRV